MRRDPELHAARLQLTTYAASANARSWFSAHADLTILAKLSCALARARAMPLAA
jgi:hypothetical protein